MITMLCIAGYIAGAYAWFGYQCAVRQDKGYFDLRFPSVGYDPGLYVQSALWVFILPMRIVGSYPRRIGEWIGERSLEAAEKRLETKKLRLAERVRVEEELKRIEASLDEELEGGEQKRMRA